MSNGLKSGTSLFILKWQHA